MTMTAIKIIAVSAAGLALTGCSVPNVSALFQAPSAQPTVAPAPVVSQAASQPVTKPKPIFAHERIGGTVNTKDGTAASVPSPSDGDETNSWN